MSQSIEPDAWLWAWYVTMNVVCVAFNLILLAAFLYKIKATTSYETTMKILAVPWVLECAYRTVFPSLYLQRFAFWDTPLNSIIVDRTWACIGELSWTYQVSLALRHVDKEISGGKCWVQLSGWLAFVIYVVAECISYYNVATTNEFWAAMEVIVDGVSFLAMWPAALYLVWCCPKGHSSGRNYLIVMTIVCLVYPLYNFAIDAPMYIKRYHIDQHSHKEYFSFWAGLKDAASRRLVTRHYDDWKADMTWMTIYFSAGAWSGLLLMFAPRLSPSTTSSAIAGDRRLDVAPYSALM